MASPLHNLLGPLEAEVMEMLWSLDEPAMVREILERLNHRREPPLAYTTVMTVMARLAEKGLLNRTPQGRGYSYEPAVADAAELAVRNVVRDFGDSAVAHFVEEARSDPALMRRLERLMKEED